MRSPTEYVGQVWWSKTFFYKTPYAVTGGVQLAGPEQAPKGICTDKIIGTW